MMISNMQIYKIRMVYFFNEKSTIRTFALISSLYDQFKEVFHTEPQSLSLPDDAPREIPRCMWNDTNAQLALSKIQLDFVFNVPTKCDWEDFLINYHQKIILCVDKNDIIIDRVGVIAEVISYDDLQSVLKQYVQIDHFNHAMEANISWLERIDNIFNVWTYFVINKSQDENRITFDVNTFPEHKLTEIGMSEQDVMKRCAQILKGKMINVL